VIPWALLTDFSLETVRARRVATQQGLRLFAVVDQALAKDR